MTTRLRRWMVPLVGLLLTAPIDAGAFDLLRNEEATIADIHAALSARTRQSISAGRFTITPGYRGNSSMIKLRHQ